MTRDEIGRQAHVRRSAAWKWFAWVLAWSAMGFHLSGGAGLIVGWAAGHALPYRFWIAVDVRIIQWDERRHVRKVLHAMGIAT
jgi:hypothetical protein